jgi:bifunctional aspartokinase / homoserine dehydrogenase 1
MNSNGASSWVVHKFGGSSVADANCFRKVADILAAQPAQRLAVVLSACKGVTDTLINLVAMAERQGPVVGVLQGLRDRHQVIAEGLLGKAVSDAWLAGFDKDRADLAGILQTTGLMRSAGQNVRDLVAGYGELWSTSLFVAYLSARRQGKAQPVRWLDARQCVVVEWGPLGPAIQWDSSHVHTGETGAVDFDGTLVIPGFVAQTPEGVQTTLGRNGSDFSASIFGALLDASEIHIWTDVDGVLSADPRRVPNAQVIDQLSYNEAMELAYFGAKVIHPQTMAPAVGKSIPIYIRNTFAPQNPCTLICAKPASQLLVKGITTIENIALINIEGAGMIGVPGTAHRLFGALREEGISVILISQGSSEHSICCAIPQNQAARAEQVVRAAFAGELDGGQIQSVDTTGDLAILAVVGDGMAGTPGVSAKVFNALGAAAINVRAIAQGASERNISVVVDGKQATRALRATHASFYLSPNTLSIGVIGPGTVGRVLLDQLASQQARLSHEFKLDLRVRGILAPNVCCYQSVALSCRGGAKSTKQAQCPRAWSASLSMCEWITSHIQ